MALRVRCDRRRCWRRWRRLGHVPVFNRKCQSRASRFLDRLCQIRRLRRSRRKRQRRPRNAQRPCGKERICKSRQNERKPEPDRRKQLLFSGRRGVFDLRVSERCKQQQQQARCSDDKRQRRNRYHGTVRRHLLDPGNCSAARIRPESWCEILFHRGRSDDNGFLFGYPNQ